MERFIPRAHASGQRSLQSNQVRGVLVSRCVMSSSLEYHIFVRHSIPASGVLLRNAFFSLFLLPVFLVSTVHAQINGAPPTSTVIPPTSTVVPPSVGRSVNPPTGAAALGPRSFVPGTGGTVPVFRAPFAYAVPVPYAVDSGAADDSADSSEDDEYQGGPTVFDRRGSGADSYVPPVKNVPMPHAEANAGAPVADPVPPPAPTVLVFKDGRQLEVGNYAIVGSILYDLTPGHPRKIALADLDLETTRRQNDDRGVAFQLPTPPQGN